MKLRFVHKRAARYLLVGMPATEVAKKLKVTESQVKMWRGHLNFKRYMYDLEAKYLELLDKDLDHIRRAALRRLWEAIEQREDIQHAEWAINKVFNLDAQKQNRRAAAEAEQQQTGQVFDSPEAKLAAKQLLLTTSNPQRYIGQTLKVGEA